ELEMRAQRVAIDQLLRRAVQGECDIGREDGLRADRKRHDQFPYGSTGWTNSRPLVNSYATGWRLSARQFGSASSTICWKLKMRVGGGVTVSAIVQPLIWKSPRSVLTGVLVCPFGLLPKGVIAATFTLPLSLVPAWLNDFAFCANVASLRSAGLDDFFAFASLAAGIFSPCGTTSFACSLPRLAGLMLMAIRTRPACRRRVRPARPPVQVRLARAAPPAALQDGWDRSSPTTACCRCSLRFPLSDIALFQRS